MNSGKDPVLYCDRARTYKLTDKEAARLRSNRPEIRHLIKACNRRLDFAGRLGGSVARNVAAFVADVVTEAETAGRIIHRVTQIKECGLCGRHAGYQTYRRSNRRRGQWKGETNYRAPLYMNGVEYAIRPVGVKGRPALGCCVACAGDVDPVLSVELETIECALPDELYSGKAQRFTWFQKVECSECKWAGHEGQMGHRPTIMYPENSYPATCPKCNASNGLGATPVKHVDGFELVSQRQPSKNIRV